MDGKISSSNPLVQQLFSHGKYERSSWLDEVFNGYIDEETAKGNWATCTSQLLLAIDSSVRVITASIDNSIPKIVGPADVIVQRYASESLRVNAKYNSIEV